MAKYLAVLLFLFFPLLVNAKTASERKVVYVPVFDRGIKNLETLNEIHQIQKLIQNDCQKFLSPYFSFSVYPKTDLSYVKPEKIASESQARFIIYGRLTHYESEPQPYHFSYYLYDSHGKKSIDFTMRASQKESSNLLYCFRRFYLYLAEQYDFFKKEIDSDKKNTSASIIVGAFELNYNTVPEELLFINDFLSSELKQNLGSFFPIISKSKNPFLLMPHYDSWSKEKHFNRLLDRFNAQGILNSDFIKLEDKWHFRLFYFDKIRRFNTSIMDIPFVNLEDLQKALTKFLPNNLYLPISLSNDYILHKIPNIGLIRRYFNFGLDWRAENKLKPYDFVSQDNGNFMANNLYSFSKISADGTIKSVIPYNDMSHQNVSCMKIQTIDKTLYCMDYQRKKIIAFDTEGKFKKSFFFSENNVTHFDVLKNTVIIPYYSSYQSGLYFYHQSGTLLKKILLENINGTPLIASSKEKLIVLSPRQDNHFEIKYFNEKGELLEKKILPLFSYYWSFTQIAVDQMENIYAFDQSKKVLVSFTQEGKIRFILDKIPAFQDGKFIGFCKISVSKDGKTLFILDSAHFNLFHYEILENFNDRSSLADLKKQFKTATQKKKLALAHTILDKEPKNFGMLDFLFDYYQKNGNTHIANEYLKQMLAYAHPKKNVIKELLKKNEVALLLEKGQHFKNIMLSISKDVGPEAAKQSYYSMITNYELAVKMDPENKSIRQEYERLKKQFGISQLEKTPEVEISSSNFEEVFSSMYKYYTENPIGKIKITNRSKVKIDKFWAELTVKDYMDYPSESPRYHVLNPGEEKTLALFAVFNNKILEINEDTPLNAQINLKFLSGGKEYTVSKKQALNLYNRNAMIWDDPRKLASFITPKDTTVKIFARDIVQQFRFARFNALNPNLQTALQIFNSLGIYGLTYIPDPKTPFIQFSKLKSKVDYIQYPRDVLRFKSGDCDDLTALYASLLENVGIETALVLVPEHILMLFNTGLPESSARDIAEDPTQTIILNGKVWIPVETTLLGKSFLEAWSTGAQKIAQYSKEEQVLFLETSKAWFQYAPVTLPPASWEPVSPNKEQVERVFFQDINRLIDRELTGKIKFWKSQLDKKPQDGKILNKIGIIYARFQKYDQAVPYFENALKSEPNYFSPYNNLGNVFLLQKKFDLALQAYGKAQQLNPQNPFVRINLALIYKELGKKEKLAAELEAAFKLNNKLKEQYSHLLESGETRASNISDMIQGINWINE